MACRRPHICVRISSYRHVTIIDCNSRSMERIICAANEFGHKVTRICETWSLRPEGTTIMSLKRLLIVLGIGLSGLTLGGCVSEGYYGSGYYDPYYYPGGTIIYDSGPAYWHDGRYYRRGWGRGWYGRPGWHGGPPPGRPVWHGGPPPGRPGWHGGPPPGGPGWRGGPPPRCPVGPGPRPGGGRLPIKPVWQ